MKSQVNEDFTDGDFLLNPTWSGDTSEFKITNSSAVPPGMKPALQTDGFQTDTSILVVYNSLLHYTEWQFWAKLSFNSSANNYARVYLVADSPNLKGAINGYYLQIGGANDSIGLYKQTESSTQLLVSAQTLFCGNSSNVFRFKILNDSIGNWELFADNTGGYEFISEGTAMDNSMDESAYFGIFCKYTASNASKFYFDDFIVKEITSDTLAPELISAQAINTHEIGIQFSENVGLSSSENPLHYNVNKGIGNPFSASRDLNQNHIVHLLFETNFQEDTTYMIKVFDLADLAGNVMDTSYCEFTFLNNMLIPPFSILINEIMADENPAPAGLPETDYLELYNATTDTINLSGFTLKPREASAPINLPSKIIYPDSFLIVLSTADTADFALYGDCLGLPGFSLNNEGIIILRDGGNNLIHSVNYSGDWYHHPDKENGGWSLEQIDPMHPCQGAINWRASENVNGGTPGSVNSVLGATVFPLQVASVQSTGNTSIFIEFNQNMDSSSIANPLAYQVEPGIGWANTVAVDENTFNQVVLNFTNSLDTNKVYTLSITDTLANCTGQEILVGGAYDVVLPAKPNPFEVVINEIMFDPDPPVGLPEFEYIEIYNTTVKYMDLRGWILQVGTTQKTIPDLIIEPGEFIVFTQLDAVNLFSLFGRSFGFSSLGLSNSGTEISLLNSSGEIISAVEYSPDWITDENKKNGGWALEQIDPLNPCAGFDNWEASIDLRGGTPGEVNAANRENQIFPEIEKIFVVNENTIKVDFNQIMSGPEMLNIESYKIDHGIGKPSFASNSENDRRTVLLVFDLNFQHGVIYELAIKADLSNCAGLFLSKGNSFNFGFHETAEYNDIIINEVLFNPVGEGVDFVEVYNRSQKIIDLAELKLGDLSIDEFGHADTNYKSVSSEHSLLLMGEYKVLTISPAIVKDQYYTEKPDEFIKMNSFPTLSNEEGTVILSNYFGKVIDIFTYNETMHHPLLATFEGVSLERIHYNRPATDLTNWHSASSDVGFATPAYQNSQFIEEGENNEEVTIYPEIFSPDNDGYNDVVNIQYTFDLPGITATISIYDAEGRMVNYLVNNEILGSNGIFSWDGRTQDNQKAPIGIYIIYFEGFDVNGNIKKYKKPVVLATKL
ncbi:MAG: lamin tail domain-containing protein [Bacteroidales bacterium]|nr:lamin tail domain-containing protein [Bacteroidales bacterium]